jgi:hypothetical protein
MWCLGVPFQSKSQKAISYHPILSTLLVGLSAIIFLLLLTVGTFCQTSANAISPQKSPSTGKVARLTFRGTAAGGTIWITIHGATLSLETEHGELASMLATRVASEINNFTTFKSDQIKATAIGDTVNLLGTSTAYVCTDDGGLHLPPRPSEVTCELCENEGKVHLRWKNPIHYDSIYLIDPGGEGFVFNLPGNTVEYFFDYKAPGAFVVPGTSSVGVVGVLSGIGCAAMCEVYLSRVDRHKK